MPTARLFNRRSLVKHLVVSGSLLAVTFGSRLRAFAQSPGPRTFGIDVSKWGEEIDWHVVISKLNPRFVLVQAYHMGEDEASSYANPRFGNYRRALQRLGLLHGAYLRCHPNASAEASIRRFWAVYTPQAGDILPTLDIEDDYDNRCSLPVQKRISQIERMVQLISTRLRGYKPMIYTKARVWGELGNPTQFADCPCGLSIITQPVSRSFRCPGRDSAFGSTQRICTATAFRGRTTVTISMALKMTCARMSYPR